jgi:hypothetical protein
MKKILSLSLILLFCYGCALIKPLIRLRQRQCCCCLIPEPSPSPTPRPPITLPPITFPPRPPITLPSPNPTPTPSPSPTPDPCNYRVDPNSQCPEGVASMYQDSVNQVLSYLTGCGINSDCPLVNWKQTQIDFMDLFNKNGYCVTYDLKGCNDYTGSPCAPGEGETGVRLFSDNQTHYFQTITTAKKVRWADAKSICTPVWDTNTLAEVKGSFYTGTTGTKSSKK